MVDIAGAFGEGLTGFTRGAAQGIAQSFQQRQIEIQEKQQQLQQKQFGLQKSLAISNVMKLPSAQRKLALDMLGKQGLVTLSDEQKQLLAKFDEDQAKAMQSLMKFARENGVTGIEFDSFLQSVPPDKMIGIVANLSNMKQAIARTAIARSNAATASARAAEVERHNRAMEGIAKTRAQTSRFGTPVPRRLTQDIKIGNRLFKAGDEITVTPIKGTGFSRVGFENPDGTKGQAVIPDARLSRAVETTRDVGTAEEAAARAGAKKAAQIRAQKYEERRDKVIEAGNRARAELPRVQGAKAIIDKGGAKIGALGGLRTSIGRMAQFLGRKDIAQRVAGKVESMEVLSAATGDLVVAMLGGQLGRQVSDKDREFVENIIGGIGDTESGFRLKLELRKITAEHAIKVADIATKAKDQADFNQKVQKLINSGEFRRKVENALAAEGRRAAKSIPVGARSVAAQRDAGAIPTSITELRNGKLYYKFIGRDGTPFWVGPE